MFQLLWTNYQHVSRMTYLVHKEQEHTCGDICLHFKVPKFKNQKAWLKGILPMCPSGWKLGRKPVARLRAHSHAVHHSAYAVHVS